MAHSTPDPSPGSFAAVLPLGAHAKSPPIPIKRPLTIIGSRKDVVRIHLESSTVSKVHCAIVLNDWGCYVRDLASRTHTLVNGEPVSEADLHDGDVLQVGRFQFKYVAPGFVAPKSDPVEGELVVSTLTDPLPIRGRVLQVGRRAGSDLQFDDVKVSNVHALLFAVNDGWQIRDLGSRTGVWANGKLVRTEAIDDGAKLRIGGATLIFRHRHLDETDEDSDAIGGLDLSAPLTLAEPPPAPPLPPILSAPPAVPLAAPSAAPLSKAPPADPAHSDLASPPPHVDEPLELEPLDFADESVAGLESIPSADALASLRRDWRAPATEPSAETPAPVEDAPREAATPEESSGDDALATVADAPAVARPAAPKGAKPQKLFEALPLDDDAVAELLAHPDAETEPVDVADLLAESAAGNAVEPVSPSLRPDNPAAAAPPAAPRPPVPLAPRPEPEPGPAEQLLDDAFAGDVAEEPVAETPGLVQDVAKIAEPAAIDETVAETSPAEASIVEPPLAEAPEAAAAAEPAELELDLEPLELDLEPLKLDDLVAETPAAAAEIAPTSPAEPAVPAEPVSPLADVLPVELNLDIEALDLDEYAADAPDAPDTLATPTPSADLARPADSTIELERLQRDDAVTEVPVGLDPVLDELPTEPPAVEAVTADLAPAETLPAAHAGDFELELEPLELDDDAAELDLTAADADAAFPRDEAADEIAPVASGIPSAFPTLDAPSVAEPNEPVVENLFKAEPVTTQAARAEAVQAEIVAEPMIDLGAQTDSAVEPIDETGADEPAADEPGLAALVVAEIAPTPEAAEIAALGDEPEPVDELAEIEFDFDLETGPVVAAAPADAEPVARTPLADLPFAGEPIDELSAKLPSPGDTTLLDVPLGDTAADGPVLESGPDAESDVDADDEIDLPTVDNPHPVGLTAQVVTDEAALDFLDDDADEADADGADAANDPAARRVDPDAEAQEELEAAKARIVPPAVNFDERPAEIGLSLATADEDDDALILDESKTDTAMALDLSAFIDKTPTDGTGDGEDDADETEWEDASPPPEPVMEADVVGEHGDGNEPGPDGDDHISPPTGGSLRDLIPDGPPLMGGMFTPAAPMSIGGSPVINFNAPPAPPQNGRRRPLRTSYGREPGRGSPFSGQSTTITEAALGGALGDVLGGSGVVSEAPARDALLTDAPAGDVSLDDASLGELSGRELSGGELSGGDLSLVGEAAESPAYPSVDVFSSPSPTEDDLKAISAPRSAPRPAPNSAPSSAPRDANNTSSSITPRIELAGPLLAPVDDDAIAEGFVETAEPSAAPANAPPDRPLLRPSEEDEIRAVAELFRPRVGTDPMGIGSIGVNPPPLALDPFGGPSAAAALRRKRYRRMMLCFVAIVLLVPAGVTAVWLGMKQYSVIDASINYEGLDGLGIEGARRFRQSQSDLLQSEQIRQAAIALLPGDIKYGFLGDPKLMQTALDRDAAVRWPADQHGVMRLRTNSLDKPGDIVRMRALAQAMIESSNAARDKLDKLRTQVTLDTQALDTAKARLNEVISALQDIQQAGNTRPDLAQITKLQDQRRQAEQALTAVKSQRQELEAAVQVLERPGSVTLSQPAADASKSTATGDNELGGLTRQLTDLQKQAEADKAAAAAQAAAARKALDESIAQFQNNLKGAQQLKQSPELAAYVDAANRIFIQTRELTEDLIRRQENQRTQLAELKARFDENSENSAKERLDKDDQLKKLRDNLAILTRQFNAATSEGDKVDAAKAQMQMQLYKNLIESREDLVKNDPIYSQTAEQLQKVIDQIQQSIVEDRRHIDEKLSRVQQDFALTAPTVEKLPDEQKALADSMEKHLVAVNDARKAYDAAADDAQARQAKIDADQKAKAAALQLEIAARRQEVAEAAAAKNARDTELARQQKLEATQSQLASIRQSEQKAQQALDDAIVANDTAERQRKAFAESDARRSDLEEQKASLEQKLKDASAALNRDQSEQADLIVPDRKIDMANFDQPDRRPIYAAGVGSALFVLLMIPVLWTLRLTSRDANLGHPGHFGIATGRNGVSGGGVGPGNEPGHGFDPVLPRPAAMTADEPVSRA